MKKLIFALLLLMFAKTVYADIYYWDVLIFMRNTEFISRENKTGFTPLRLALFQDLSLPYHVKTVGGIDLGIISTKVENVYGLQLGLMSTAGGLIGLQTGVYAVSDDMSGIQLGLIAYSFSQVSGLQLSMMWSGVEGQGFSGLQAGGLYSSSEGTSYGLQLGGVTAYSRDTVMGVQIAGIEGCGAVKGLSIAPVKIMGTSHSTGLDNSGLSISVFNYGVRSEDRGKYGFDGLMISGANISNADIMGAQLGLFNSASLVKGVQIGVVNYATKLSGVQIGVINIAKNAAVLVLPVINFSF